MNVPPFPSQDLAKLVLGYLAEEQLMTAYDEFLQASPYLDAMRNEYDRIFMTSLRNILAEYRAVKIFVETCKPFSLRKKLFQCLNLLDIVKFLVNNIDINKLQEHDKTSDKQETNSPTKVICCEICNLPKLPNCGCKSKQPSVNSSCDQNNYEAQINTNTSVEATSLADLPGSYVTNREKQVKVLERCSIPSTNVHCVNVPNINENIQPQINEFPVGNKVNYTAKGIESSEKLQVAFNENMVQSHTYNSVPVSDNFSQNVCTASTFQDFAAGVAGGEICTNNVPDSITSESFSSRIPIQKEANEITCDMKSTKHQFVLKVSAINENKLNKSSEVLNNNTVTVPKTNTKVEDHKIKILSDIKVDNYGEPQKDIPAVLKNATSTPLMQMQTIVINGAPAYKHQPISANLQSFTKDEIMAMPTLIVVPSSSVPVLHPKTTQPTVASTSPSISCTQTKVDNPVLSPLVIDVTSSPCQDNINVPNTVNDSENIKEIGIEMGLIKTVNCHKNMSAPKDVTVTCESSTPQVFPILRKSSSTPRRNSHIRVLDFTTPRRILHETSSEYGGTQNPDCPVEVVISGSPDCLALSRGHSKDVTVEITNDGVDNVPIKDNDDLNKDKKPKKKNWDADLRALVAADASNSTLKSISSKVKKGRKKKAELKTIEEVDIKDETKSGGSKNKSSTKTKRKQIIEEEEPEAVINSKSNTVPVKPTINIKPGHDWGSSTQDNKKGVEIPPENNVSPQENNDTPEMERLSLHNDIGGKLNISDIFETPYKQAFYDIQMETPRFLRLGPDLPDEPMSDIKIMNIPTPRFLDTPKPLQTTPSSYSSRPTDYSSGGSYYKPDDQDYIPVSNIVFSATATKEVATVSSKDTENNKKNSRPIRKCTKNVSYYNKSILEKDALEKADMGLHSDTTRINSSIHKNEPVVDSKQIPESKSKNVAKKKNSVKKRKTPVKKEKPKTFMKIKPRRMTPTKETIGGRGRKKSDKPRNNSPAAKRANTKENNHLTPVIASVPTKSRRKSSTPRKLHCSKTFNSESSGQDSPSNVINVKSNQTDSNANTQVTTTQDFDTEPLSLRWSDDGSQDTKLKDEQEKTNDVEDVSNIQAYIETTVLQDSKSCDAQEGTLQIDLIKRGFDAETAKRIERDLLDTPPHSEISRSSTMKPVEIIQAKKDDVVSERTIETDSSATNGLQIVDEMEDDIDLSVYNCDEESENYILIQHDDTSNAPQVPTEKVKDTYTMEICVEGEEIIRLRAMPFTTLVDHNFEECNKNYDKETEDAINSISNYERLYTPLKESIKTQCYEIFDSTLTSLDTPLKGPGSPKVIREVTVTEIVLEEKEFKETKKRKRLQNSNSSEDSINENKRIKPDPKDLLKSTNIQNFDIETVLTKLHGH